jgi:hypothetical protein
MCPYVFHGAIEIRVMLPDHLICQCKHWVAPNYEGFRGALWKCPEFKLPGDSLSLVPSECTEAAGDPAR